jgi:virginiamycin B lyase
MPLAGRPLTRTAARLTTLALAGAALAAVPGLTSPASAATRIIPVPTSSAGVGRIVTAPNGNMWFVERDANKVGRITPSGQITEFPLPAQFPGTSKTEDLDVAPDGNVWVVYESGSRIRKMNGNGVTVLDGELDGSGYPYGEQVRVGRDGTAWVTMSYDEDFVVRIVGNQIYSSANAPACEDALGEANDGSMWCRTSSGLTHLNGTASGGVAYPVNHYAAYPYAIAAGPVGSIWFGRYFDGTIFTSPDAGEVGYLNAANGQVRAFNTGDRTAPSDLVRGPDNNMWFTSIGAAAGIGHISAQGRGALTAIGNYEPAHLTFAKNGTIFATDPTNNVIIQTTMDQLQRTNVNPGAGSVLTGGTAGTVGRPAPGRKAVTVRRNKVPVRVACPAGRVACRGTVTLRTVKKGQKVVARTASYSLRPGTRRTLKLALTKQGRKLVRRHRVTRLQVTLASPGARTVRAVVKVRR